MWVMRVKMRKCLARKCVFNFFLKNKKRSKGLFQMAKSLKSTRTYAPTPLGLKTFSLYIVKW